MDARLTLHAQTTPDDAGRGADTGSDIPSEVEDLDIEIDSRDGPPADDHQNPYITMLGHWWRLLLVIVLVGAGLVMVYERLPFLRPGSRVIESAKLEYVTTPGLFSRGDSVRVVVVGNSRVLAGFVPDAFDDTASCSTHSVNVGFPAAVDFVDDLDAMVEAGNVPDVVLVQRPWTFAGSSADDGTFGSLADRFESRFLLRDVSAFVDEAGGPTEVVEHYRVGQDAVEQMEADRGWYFIDGESLYEDDRLPDDLVLPDDQPDTEFVRTLPMAGPSYRRVQTLIDEGVEFILVPNPEREGAFAPPASSSPLADDVADIDGLSVLGPELVLYPNALFADPVHLNPEGAAQWSADLAALVDEHICGAG